jgi:FixJ family two-component response regulator
MKTKKTKKKLTKRERQLASRFIEEEYGHFPRKQAVAVGISRARREAERERMKAIIAKYR